MNMTENKVNIVTVCWWDGYKEDFRATEVRFGSDLLWMRLEDGNNRSHSFKNGSLVWYFYWESSEYRNVGGLLAIADN